MREFGNRMVEIANGVDAALEIRLVRAEAGKRIITVRQDGTGEFKTVTDAVKSIPPGNSRRTIIKIGPGVYREKVLVDRSRPFVTFLGDPHAMAVITFDGTAAKFGTWNSATVAVESQFFMAANIVFENSAPMPADGEEGGQAVAMRISGDKAAFYNCKFLGYQDTLLDDVGKHYFQDCFIRGSVDFIFGTGRSLYMKCELHSVAKGITALTAHGRLGKSDSGGFAFVNCVISGSGSAYLSRAWKESSRVVFLYTYMGALVNPKGWDDKGFQDRQRTVYYAEYKCKGPGANTGGRVKFGRQLNDNQAQPYLSKTFIHATTWLLPPPSV
ncbi:hypothetical protein MRB53_029784 [Persea americana]|uniref:Uncharacterized protein n=1 Tax=Persea americana TaxID=3435 RepID=A0ACC2KJC6_PERAE|nr:hypothetical protein MRB53_029784 [Persea americana]